MALDKKLKPLSTRDKLLIAETDITNLNAQEEVFRGQIRDLEHKIEVNRRKISRKTIYKLKLQKDLKNGRV